MQRVVIRSTCTRISCHQTTRSHLSINARRGVATDAAVAVPQTQPKPKKQFYERRLPLALDIDKLLDPRKKRNYGAYLNTSNMLLHKYETGESSFEGESSDLVATISAMGQNAVLGPLVISAVVMDRFQHFRIGSEVEYKKHTEKSYVKEHWNASYPGIDTTSVVFSSSYIDEQAALGISTDQLLERGTKLLFNWIEKVRKGNEHTIINNPADAVAKALGDDIDKKVVKLCLHPSIPQQLSDVAREMFPECNTEKDSLLMNYAYWTAFYKRKDLLDECHSAQDNQIPLGSGYIDSTVTQRYMTVYKRQTDEEAAKYTPLRQSNQEVQRFLSGDLVFNLPLEPSDDINRTLSEIGGSYASNERIEKNDLLRLL